MRFARKLREAAIDYAANGWPISALLVPRDGLCPCPRRTCALPHLHDRRIVTDAARAAELWERHPWDIALMTTDFDVVELPPHLGAPLHHELKTTCPTALVPRGRRWQFFVVRGAVDAGVVSAAGGTVHAGTDAWVPAPGTHTELTGRIRWIVPPYQNQWRAHRRMDAFDRVLLPA